MRRALVAHIITLIQVLLLVSTATHGLAVRRK